DFGFWIRMAHLNPKSKIQNLKYLQPQSVISQPHVLRQPRLDRGVIDLVGQMNQPALTRADPLSARYRLGNGEVGGMPRRRAESVERENLDVAQQAHGGVGDAVGVGDVGEAADAKSEDGP